MNRFDSAVFLENIEWLDESGDELVRRLPETGSGEIKFGAQLTVRESQAAVLFYQGKACDSFGAGRHTLKTWNLPLITKLLSIPWRGDSPLRAEVYIVNLKYFTNMKWGTQNPVAFRDNELGLIRLRAHGMFNFRIVQPVLFINSMVGTMEKMTGEEIANYLRMVIVSRLNDFLGEKLDTILNLPGRFDEITEELTKRLEKDFMRFGLALTDLFLTSITPPPEVQGAIDDKSRMGVIQDMDKFMKMKAAMAMEKAAATQGEAGAGMGLGLGMMLPGMFASTQAGTAVQHIQNEASPKSECPDCHNTISADARFCPVCGHQQVLLSQCSNCGKNLTPKARFCSQCGTPAETRKSIKICTDCNTENLPESMFCNQCGNRLA